jgi:hypothetical protein
MHRPAAARVLAFALVLVAAGCGGRRAAVPSRDVPGVATARRVNVELRLGRESIGATEETMPFTLRLTNPEREAMRVDFTGDPLYPRGPRDKAPIPALWYMIERYDRASHVGSISQTFSSRDTVLAAGETMEVPVEHALRQMGMNPGTYRIRGGIGAHASGWVLFTVTK